jgi:calcium/calmodulin-dependent protein kinase kinase 2
MCLRVLIPEDVNPDLTDLLRKLLEKDPNKRIKMPELRVRTDD